MASARRLGGIVVAAFVLALLLLAAREAREVQRDLARPALLPRTGYIGSAACVRCHGQRYESFARTYHRTMTQEASERSVLGRFDGRTLDYMGVRARMHRGSRGEFLIAWHDGRDSWQAEVVRTVGSHRYQQYLARDRDVYFRLPVAWDVAEQRFLHMNGAFLTPDPPEPLPGAAVSRADYDRHVTRWNDNCLFCHNVHPSPGLDPRTFVFETTAAELGIACEACHGPGREHEARNQSPLRRYALHLSSAPDPTITSPSRLPAARSTEICGRCHGQRIAKDIAEVHEHGDDFVPGEPLSKHSRPLTRDSTLNGEHGVFAARFWRDGTPRLTAYELQGHLLSPCNRGGAFDCSSCHSMHEGDPDGQLRPSLAGDAVCTQCHVGYADPKQQAAHTRHDEAGSGARCIGCHMPSIVYGLVGVRISHRIEVPDASRSAADGRPDACTSCHVDRTRAWASTQVARLWGVQKAKPEAPSELSEVNERLLSGDPIERAIAADALGRDGAHHAPAYLARVVGSLADAAVEDDYPAVRGIAFRALRAVLERAHPGHASLLADYSPTQPRAARRKTLDSLAAALGPSGMVVLERSERERLRGLSRVVTIEIGE